MRANEQKMSTQSTVGAPTQLFEPLLDSREAAALLRMHHKTLERKARDGEIPGYQILGKWCFRASELDGWLKSQLNSSSQSRRVN
jgi:excisionase family DNA binding protein